MRLPEHPRLLGPCVLALTTAALGSPVMAMDFDLADSVLLRVRGTLTLGSAVRTEAPDPTVLGVLSAARVGAAPGYLSGNSGGSDLNFTKGQPVSTVVKGLFSMELTRQGFGLSVRAKAWYDQELKEGDRPYGNAPNRFAQNVPLSDSGFDPHARFANAVIEDANVFGRFALGESTNLEVRVGRQVVNWGMARLTAGGLNIVNPPDLPAALRPGAMPEEGRLPVGMAYGRLGVGKETTIEAWAQYEFRPSVLPGCGTYYALTNYAPRGCNYVSVLGTVGVDDPTALSTGRFPRRQPDVVAKNSGQFGLSLAHHLASINTHLHAYAASYHSRVPSVRVTNANVNGGYGDLGPRLTRLTDPNGLSYAMVFAENIRMLGLAAETAIDPTAHLYAELAYRPNQPLDLNPSDLVAAFLRRSPTSALNLAKGTNALPPGASFDGYDRYKMSNLVAGASKSIHALAGAQRMTLTAEMAWNHVSGLPDAGRLRYGRSDDYGVAQVKGGAPCIDTTLAQKSCAIDGFVTANAWGYRLRAVANYPGALFGAALTPSITFAHDVGGYTIDNTLNQGRKVLRTALRADWGPQVFAETAYTRIQGGRYLTTIDRDTLVVFGGIRF